MIAQKGTQDRNRNCLVGGRGEGWDNRCEQMVTLTDMHSLRVTVWRSPYYKLTNKLWFVTHTSGTSQASHLVHSNTYHERSHGGVLEIFETGNHQHGLYHHETEIITEVGRDFNFSVAVYTVNFDNAVDGKC